MVTMIVVIVLTNHQNIAKAKVVLASVTYLPVIMVTVFLEFIYAMAITTVWITATKITGINAVSFYNKNFIRKLLSVVNF